MKRSVATYASTILLLSLLTAGVQAAPSERGRGQARAQEQAGESATATPEGASQSEAAQQGRSSEMRTMQGQEGAGQAESRKEAAKARLESAKLKACQGREKGMQKRSDMLVSRADRMVAKFTEIAAKVDAYHADTLVGSGRAVSNYAVLKSDIDTKKTAVEAALASAKESLSSFSCDGEDPKGAMAEFRSDIQAVNRALKEHRTAVKSLIVAVRTAAGDSEEAARPSPTASSTPEASL